MIVKFLFFLALCTQAIRADTHTPYEVHQIFVQAKDAHLFCQTAGSGKPLFVLHGGPGLTQDYFFPNMYQLAENFHLIFYDQRGCGKSRGDINAKTITLKTFVDDIEAIRKAFNLEKISILGHSWGALLQ